MSPADLEGASPLLLWIAVLVAMLFMPFLMVMVTSFAKLIIVAGILRQALGTPQIPPTSVLTGLALVFSLCIMAPVAKEAHALMVAEPVPAGGAVAGPEQLAGPGSVGAAAANAGIDLTRVVPACVSALREFMKRHTREDDYLVVKELRVAVEPPPALPTEVARGDAIVTPDGPPPAPKPTVTPQFDAAFEELFEFLTIDTPAFVMSQLTDAFRIGFLLFVPFIVIDLVISNLLLAMGMHMLSPVVVSLPVKLLVFVSIDGWQLILSGLVQSYATTA